MFKWLENWIGRPIDGKLAALQAGVAAAFSAIVVATIALYHHFSDEFIVDFDEYLWSVNIAVPPLLAFFASILIAVGTGTGISEAPKKVLRYTRNVFLQSRRAMGLTVLLSACFTLGSVLYISRSPPPAYAALVAMLLGGESDEHRVFHDALKPLAVLNPVRARQYASAAAVFDERRRWNSGSKVVTTILPHTFVRTLDANVHDDDWVDHPLRKHALAEAYSMWGEAASELGRTLGALSGGEAERARYSTEALRLYEEVAASTSRYATPLIRASAKLNAGNVHLYAKRFAAAADIYLAMLEDDATWNMSAAGNLFAAYLKMRRPKEVLRLADAVLERAYATGEAMRQPSNHASVLEAIGFAHLLSGDTGQALPYFRSSYELLNDTMTKQNLALVLTLADRRDLARTMISAAGFEPITAESQSKRLAAGQSLGCTAFVWGIVEDDTPAAAAPYFYAYLGMPRTAAQLKAETAQSLRSLKRQVASALKVNAGPCSDLLLVPQIRERLGVATPAPPQGKK